jgi:hypothetical protein
MTGIFQKSAAEFIGTFRIAPIVGAVLAGWVYRILSPETGEIPVLKPVRESAVS